MNIKCCMNCRKLDCQFLFFFQEKMVEQGHRHKPQIINNDKSKISKVYNIIFTQI